MARTIDDGIETLYGAGQQYVASAAPYQPAPLPETDYSLGGGGFGDYNISMDANAMPDGLGHYTLDGGASWLNSDGSPYQDTSIPFAPDSWSEPQNGWAGNPNVGDPWNADGGWGNDADASNYPTGKYNPYGGFGDVIDRRDFDPYGAASAGGGGGSYLYGQQEGPQWVDDGSPGGRYVDQWGNYSTDGGNTWQSPGAGYQSPDRGFGGGDIEDVYNPVPFAPQSWNEPAPEETNYNLGFPTSALNGYGSPNAQDPWSANNQQEDDTPWWQKGANAIGDSFVDTAKTFGNVIAAPYVAAEDMFSDKTGTGFNDRVEANFSGEKAQDLLGVDTSYMDWLREQGILGKTAAYGIDTLTAPATLLTAGLGPEAGAIGSAFGGGFAKQLAGETALGTAAYLGSDAAVSDVADKIPYFSDQPDWLRQIEGGLVGGIGAFGGIKAAGKSLDTAGGFKGLLAGEGGETPPLFPKGQGDAAIPSSGSLPTDTALNPPRRKLLDALDAEQKFRTSGEADALISQGRAQQAKGIGGAIDNLGDSFSENVGAIRGGAKTGKMLPTTQGLALDDDTMNALLREAIDYNGGKQFNNLNAAKALDKLQKGERLQPAEIKNLRAIFGDDVGDAIAKGNAGRISSVAELTPADVAEITRKAQVDGKRAATMEVQAKRQHELADDLQKQLSMDPTNKRLKTAVEDARARAIKQQNDADRILADRAEKATANLPQRTEAGILKGETSKYGSVDDALKNDKRLAAEEAKVRKAAEDEWIRGLDNERPDEFATQMARNERNAERSLSAAQLAAKKAAGEKASAEWARSLDYPQADEYARVMARNENSAEKGLGAAQDKARAQQMRASNQARINASDEQMITRAKDVIAKLDMPDNIKSVAIDTIEAGAKKIRVLSDGMGTDGPSIVRRIYAGVTGEVTDSYTSQLLTQRAFIQNALESQGYSKATAKQVGKLLQDADIRFRYGDNIPKYVTDSLEQAKFDFAEGGAIRGLADISQELKNTQFGIGDLAVFGQQGAKLGATNLPQFVAGLVNRALNHWTAGIDTGLEGLAKSTAYQLDGLARKSVAITDITNEKTLVSRFGPAGRFIDSKALVPATKWLTDLQFDHILGKAREITYEGNLVLAKLVGEDISNPAVRLRAAEWANAASGAGKLAQQAGRANAEKAFLLSPSMRRAQLQQIGQVMKGLSGAQGKQGMVYALATVSSMAGALAAAKAINDRYGVSEFVWDPSQPGFGNITLPGGHVVNPFSQEQVVKVFAKSLDVLRDGDLSKEEVTNLAKEWGKLGISSASPAIRPFLAQVGVGYDPGKGYAFGDLGDGKGFTQKLIDAAPIPPIAQQMLRGDMPNPLDVLGVANYPESKYSQRDNEARTKYGKPWGELSEQQQFDLTKEIGRAYSSNPTIKAQQKEADAIHAEQLSRQQARDAELTNGNWTPAKASEWRDKRKEDNLYFKGRFDQLYKGVDFTDTNITDLDRYGKAIADATDPVTGDIDFDKVDAATKGLDQEYIKANSGLRDTDLERSYSKATDVIEASGYFDRTEATWAKVQKTNDEAKQYPDYYAWKDAKLEEQTQKFMDRYGYDRMYAAAMAEKAVNASAPEKIYDGNSKAWKAEWVQDNPAAAYQAWTWGYYTPTDDMKAYLNKWAKGQ